MIIVGIDPGTRHLGWGIVRSEGTRLVHEGHGIIHLDPSLPLAMRLVVIEKELTKVVEDYQPQQAAVESLFFAKDVQAASKLGHARGVVLLVVAKNGLPVYEYAPARVKRSVSGRGRADKHQVAMMVRALLNMNTTPGVDATDALAVAITHAQFARMDNILREARR